MIIYFDTETTGLNPGSVIQLSYIIETASGFSAKNMFFKVGYIEPSAVAVHGFTVEDVAILSGGKTFADRLDEIANDFKDADMLVSHNFSFDFNFMSAEFMRAGKNFYYKESFDTMRYFTPIMQLKREGKTGFKYPKLTEFAKYADVYDFEVEKFSEKYYGQTDVKSHDARFDTAQMFMAVKNSAEKLPKLDEFLKKHL